MKLLPQTLLLICVLFLSIVVNAQSESTNQSSELFPKTGDFGVTLMVGGLIDDIQLNTREVPLGQNILFGRYYLADDMALRLGFGIDLTNTTTSNADTIDQVYVESDSTFSRFSFNISGGIEKHLKATSRLDPYLFGQLNLTFIGKEVIDAEAIATSGNAEAKVDYDKKTDGGIGIGIETGAGFNYFIAPRFSLGTELGLIFQYSSVGGTISENLITTDPAGNVDSDFNRSERQVSELTIGVNTTALINFSYFF